MPAVWTTPATWYAGEPITAAKLNQQLRDNIEYVKSRPKHVVNYTGSSNISVTSTSMAAVDDSIFSLTAEFNLGFALIWFNSQFYSNTAGTWLILDVIIDDTTYVSSNSSTPLTNGITKQGIFTTGAGNNTGINFMVTHNYLLSGVHTFKLRGYRQTATAVLQGGSFMQFGVMEI